jgi:predicted dehydrogenase
VASVGLGWWGGVLADKAATAGLEVATCWSPSSASRARFAQAHGCEREDSLDAVLARPDVAAVLLATPHSTHTRLVERCAEAGKDVFVEKPLALSYADGLRAVVAAERGGVLLQVGHMRRRQPAVRRLKGLVDSGALGVIHHVEGNLSYPKGLTPRTGWRGDPAESPVGGMTGLGVHVLDTLIYLVGRPTRIAAFSRQVLAPGTLDDATVVSLELESGPLGLLATSMVVPDVATIGVLGTQAGAWSEGDGARFYHQPVGETTRTEEPVDVLDTVADELAEFARCVRTRAEPEVGGREGLEVTAVLEAIVTSVEHGRVVSLDEIRDE